MKVLQTKRRDEEQDEAPEPIGHLTFGPTEGGPLTAESTIEDWYRRARIEFALSRAILPILNSTDKEIEESVTSAPDPAAALDRLVTLLELCIDICNKHKGWQDTLRQARCALNVEYRADVKLLAGIRQLAAHTTIDEKAVAAILATATEKLEHADKGDLDMVCGFLTCRHCHPELAVDEATHEALDLARRERSEERRRADIQRVTERCYRQVGRAQS
jgi:hypothetical protein